MKSPDPSPGPRQWGGGDAQHLGPASQQAQDGVGRREEEGHEQAARWQG